VYEIGVLVLLVRCVLFACIAVAAVILFTSIIVASVNLFASVTVISVIFDEWHTMCDCPHIFRNKNDCI
jgi:hypothetical protein